MNVPFAYPFKYQDENGLRSSYAFVEALYCAMPCILIRSHPLPASAPALKLRNAIGVKETESFGMSEIGVISKLPVSVILFPEKNGLSLCNTGISYEALSVVRACRPLYAPVIGAKCDASAATYADFGYHAKSVTAEKL